MENLVKCPQWREYQGLNGWVMFCSAGAFAKTLSRAEAEEIGCTQEQRENCKRIMELNLGYSLQPEIVEAEEQPVINIETAPEVPDYAAEEKNLEEYPDLLTVAMVASYLNISHSKTLMLIKNGSIPAVRKGDELHVEKAKLEEWLKCTA
ncbi:MAG: excisionase family DNA-binding protein [Firmicutes bacterium]|jgi:excisionase family DNA binding protein|nr:excisionase family DNA-binding protein [Bacillota bacterium]